MKIVSILLLLAFHLNASAQKQSKVLSPVEMHHDLSILQSAWQNLHPGLFRYNTPQQLQAHFNIIKQKCKIPLAEKAFYLLLSQLAQQVKCGHTFLNPLNMPKETQKRILPANYIIPVFFEVITGKKIIITHNLAGNPGFDRGDEIVAINGISAKRIIDSLLTVSRSDGRNSTGKKLNNINETPDEADAYSLFDIYFPIFFPPSTTTFKITLKKYSATTTSSYSINATTLDARIAVYEKLFGKVPVVEKTWDYRILNDQTAYAKFGTFAFWNSNFNATGYVDSIFNNISRKPEIKNLIIDIRNNEGGDNTGNYILSYVTSNKIGCDDPDKMCYRYQTIPDSLLPHLDTWDNSFKKPKDPTKFRLNEIGLYEAKNDGEPCDYINPKPTVFKGKVFLLTNAKNSSAGYEMARNFRTANIGTIVGETTGGSQQGINGGEFFFLTLPNSTFEIDLPLIYGYHANKPDEGIIPDYQIKTNQKDIKNKKDPQLEFVLLQIAKQKKGN